MLADRRRHHVDAGNVQRICASSPSTTPRSDAAHATDLLAGPRDDHQTRRSTFRLAPSSRRAALRVETIRERARETGGHVLHDDDRHRKIGGQLGMMCESATGPPVDVPIATHSKPSAARASRGRGGGCAAARPVARGGAPRWMRIVLRIARRYTPRERTLDFVDQFARTFLMSTSRNPALG